MSGLEATTSVQGVDIFASCSDSDLELGHSLSDRSFGETLSVHHLPARDMCNFKSGFLRAILGFRDMYCSEIVFLVVLLKVPGVCAREVLSGAPAVLLCLLLTACLWGQPTPCTVFPNPRGGGPFDPTQRCFPCLSRFSLMGLAALSSHLLPLVFGGYLILVLQLSWFSTMSVATAFFRLCSKVTSGPVVISSSC